MLTHEVDIAFSPQSRVGSLAVSDDGKIIAWSESDHSVNISVEMEKAQKIRLLEQEIMQVEQQLSAQVSKEELRLTEGYILKTNDFMQDIGQRLGYDYVMSYRVGGAMLYANPNHDITNEIIELLNQEYESVK